MLNTSDIHKIINSISNFNKSWKQFTGKINLNATMNQIGSETNINQLFVRNREFKDITNLQCRDYFGRLYNGCVPVLGFFKGFDGVDLLLSGLPKQSCNKNDKTNYLQHCKIQKQNKSHDLTRKFKQRYLVGKVIGQGAYASVRVAMYRPEQLKVAIKVYEKSKLSKFQRKRSFLRQISVMSCIDHENIVRILDVIQSNNHLNIVMEYLQGISLSQFVKRYQNKKLNEKQCRTIFKGLASALCYLQNLNISHRDIKLENVLVDNNLNPKLIDFGFSTCMRQGEHIQIYCGTPNYMAPEIVQRKQFCGMKADIWALGVLFFILFTGQFPFKASTDLQLHHKIIHLQYPRSLISHNRQIYELIGSMLRLNPEQRITPSQILRNQWILGQNNKRTSSKSKSNKKMKKLDTLAYDKKRSHTIIPAYTDKKVQTKHTKNKKLTTQLLPNQNTIATDSKIYVINQSYLNKTLKPRSTSSLSTKKMTIKQQSTFTKKQRKKDQIKNKTLNKNDSKSYKNKSKTRFS